MREMIEPIQDTEDDETSDHNSKLAWLKEANKAKDKEAADRAAEDVVGEATATPII